MSKIEAYHLTFRIKTAAQSQAVTANPISPVREKDPADVPGPLFQLGLERYRPLGLAAKAGGFHDPLAS
jgi:hypothetical protein